MRLEDEDLLQSMLGRAEQSCLKMAVEYQEQATCMYHCLHLIVVLYTLSARSGASIIREVGT